MVCFNVTVLHGFSQTRRSAKRKQIFVFLITLPIMTMVWGIYPDFSSWVHLPFLD